MEFSSFGNLSIKKGNSNRLITTGEDNILDNLISKVKNNKLILSLKNNVSLQPTQDIQYTLNIPNYIQEFNLNGSGSVSIDDIKTTNFDATISGSGKIEIKELNTTNFDATISGSGYIYIAKGKTEKQQLNIKGSGNYQAKEFTVDKIYASIMGSGTALINAINFVSIEILGSGTFKYYGTPSSFQYDIRGSGSIKKMYN